MRHFPPPKRTMTDKRAAFVSALHWCRKLEGEGFASLCRTSGLPDAEVAQMVAAERTRREARG